MPSSEETNATQLTRDIAPDRAELLKGYAEQDALLGSPNPRYKQCKLYCDRYLNVRVQLVGTEGLNDTDWDLTIF